MTIKRVKIGQRVRIADICQSQLVANSRLIEEIRPRGIFNAVLFDRRGNEKWREEFPNTVVGVAKNFVLDTVLAGAAYTVTGPFLGLISSVSFSGISVNDTMAAHAGWREAGLANVPIYSGNRKTAAFSAAASGSKTLTAPLAFTFTGSGTVKGAFLVLGAGALATKDNAAGTLYSAGLFVSGDRAVQDTDILNISYTALAA